MANTLSAAKNARKARRRHKQRVAVKSELKTLKKKTLEAISAKTAPEELKKMVKVTVKKLAKAAANKYIHRRTASRKIGRLMKQIHKQAPQAAL